MKVKQIHLKNLGPIEELRIIPRNVDGRPVPIVIVGQNGAGKSLLLSTVLDAMTEARRAAFSKLAEVTENSYLRMSQKTYVRSGALYSHAQITFDIEGRDVVFDDVVSRTSYEELEQIDPAVAKIPASRLGEFKRSGFFKNIDINENGLSL